MGPGELAEAVGAGVELSTEQVEATSVRTDGGFSDGSEFSGETEKARFIVQVGRPEMFAPDRARHPVCIADRWIVGTTGEKLYDPFGVVPSGSPAGLLEGEEQGESGAPAAAGPNFAVALAIEDEAPDLIATFQRGQLMSGSRNNSAGS